MIDEQVLARCNLFAVLKNVEYLTIADKECSEIAKTKNIAIQFKILKGPTATLTFCDGIATLERGKKKNDIKLLFTSFSHFNKMIDGKAMPIPLKGFFKLKFLTDQFTRITKKLEFYLRSTKEKLQGAAYYKANTEMTFYTAFFALAEIGNYDEIGKLNAKKVPNGVIQASINTDTGAYIEVKNGKLEAKKGFYKNPTAILNFTDLTTAQEILSGSGDLFVAIANNKLEMKGFIPMIDNMNPILDLVSKYLA